VRLVNLENFGRTTSRFRAFVSEVQSRASPVYQPPQLQPPRLAADMETSDGDAYTSGDSRNGDSTRSALSDTGDDHGSHHASRTEWPRVICGGKQSQRTRLTGFEFPIDTTPTTSTRRFE